MKVFNLINGRKDKLIDAAQSKIRERAISQTKSMIALQGKQSSDFTPEALENMVADKEKELVGELKTKSLVVVAAALGFGVF